MKSYKFFLCCCMVGLASLSSCSKEPEESCEIGDLSPIRPQAGVAVEAESRADLGGVVSGTTFPASTDKVFSVVGYSGTAAPTAWSSPYIANIAVNSGTSSELGFATPQYYPANGDKVYFYAYSPGKSASYAAGNGSTTPKVTWTVDGSQDIMWAKVDKGIAKNPVPASQEQPSFAFVHKLKQVTFKVKKDATFEDNVKLTSLQIVGAKTSASMDLSTGALTWSGSGSLTVYSDATGLPLGTTAADAGSAVMFEPGATFQVQAVAGGVTYAAATVTLSGTNAGQAGVSHEVTLTFKRKEVAASASIAAWTSGGDVAGADDAYPYVANGNTIVLQDVSGQAALDTYPMHEPWTVTPAHSETAWNGNTSGLNVYGEKFQVAKSDASGKSAGSTTMNWFEASGTTDVTNNATGYSACAAYSEASDASDRGTWRLPTVRELKLIYDKKGELTAAALPTANTYWAATGVSETNAWTVSFSNGSATSIVKTGSTHRVRCVRDL